MNGERMFQTRVLPVDARKIGKLETIDHQDDILDELKIDLDFTSPDAARLQFAADQLRHADVPVAFPTETVYGLGADATRSAAVNGIYKAKRRPADNPLIVHFSSLGQIRKLLRRTALSSSSPNEAISNGNDQDPIPPIYHPLIQRFWPGPLTIILSNPPQSSLAPEVTAGLKTFGARIPRHPLALALISLADRPVAAPSANASTKPSPTAAEHVAHDLNGRIETIIDGGPCDVGVESTVVDGLSQPPVVLRPGGISIEQLRSCPGWEDTQVAYKNVAEGESQPRAPGMKYRHYSPAATVVLYEADQPPPNAIKLVERLGPTKKIGLVTTKQWVVEPRHLDSVIGKRTQDNAATNQVKGNDHAAGFRAMLDSLCATVDPQASIQSHKVRHEGDQFTLLTIALGSDTDSIARGIFFALRELDRENVDAIFVEGIDEHQGDLAAAIVNRLRKAAEIHVNR